MKNRTLSLLLCILMIAALTPAFAYAEALPPDVACVQGHITEVGNEYYIGVEGKARNGGTLSYLWYETSTGNIMDIIAIGAHSGNEITTPQMKVDTSATGTFYYVCMVTETFNGGETFAYSPVIKVQVDKKNLPLGIEIIKMPYKLDYAVGDYIDLSGLQLRLHTTNGDIDMGDIEYVTASPTHLTKAGTQTITLKYCDMTASFKVKVAEKEDAAEADGVDDVLMAAPEETAPADISSEEESGGVQWWIIAIPAAVIVAAAAIILIKKKK